jgi:HupE / UreJ protein
MWSQYLKLGFDHILDPNGYDHILFVAVLCALYSPTEWKKVIWLVTAFTIGHSLTLGLSALDIINISSSLIERLIPVTIILTALYNIFITLKPRQTDLGIRYHYMMAVNFGFIHGLGFSNFFNSIIGSGQEIILPLFAFNIGVEIGQIIVITFIMVLGYLFLQKLKMPMKFWTIPLSLLGIGVATYLLLGR